MTESNENLQPSLPEDVEKYGDHYNETDFEAKLQNLPRSALGKVLRRALILRELLFDQATPLWVRGTIVGALGYLILPFDLVPDFLPVVGFLDDLAAMGMVLASLDSLVTEDIRTRALKRMP